jgi:hypothetical protein
MIQKNGRPANAATHLSAQIFISKRSLLQNIFGVDIDAQAVEVTKLSLLFPFKGITTAIFSLLKEPRPYCGSLAYCLSSLRILG